MCVPLTSRDRILGVVTLVAGAESGRRFGASDLACAEQLAARAAIAIDNARLYEATQRELEARATAERALRESELRLKAIADEREALLASERAARSEAERLSHVKDEFLATLSHELRTPLNAIGGYAQLMEDGVGGEVSDRQHEWLSRIRASQQHLLGIVNDLLNYTRIEAGEVAYESVVVPVHELVEGVLSMVSPQAGRKGHRLVHGACAHDVAARADPLKVEQIVLNLLSNAVKFTPDGGTITVSCEAGAGVVNIVVRDTGPGIPEDMRTAVFEPFVQLGRNLTSAHEGTGLGLSISRDLARAMGGDESVAGAAGEGAIFTLTLPAA
jgi:signal transduction histidine kinase